MPGDQAVHPLAFGRIPMPPRHRRHKPAFIDVHGVFAQAHEPLTKVEELFSSERVAVGIAQSFFTGHPQFSQRVPDTVPGDLELPCPFRLSLIGLCLHMPTQRLPIQLAGQAKAGTLVRQAARLEPVVHARLTDLEPLSRFGLAASTANKLHDPLAQIC